MKLPAISTRELGNFVLLASSQTLKDAAEKCALSQPAFSIQLKQLETKIGAQLVLRSHAQKGIELTAAGTEFFRAARQALQVLQEAVDRIGPATDSGRPILRVACLPSLLQDMISPVLADISRRQPTAQISIQDGDSSACSTLLSAKKCDVAICSRPVNGPDIKSQCLFSERFCVVLRRTDDLARRPHLALDDFLGSTVVNLSDNFTVNASLVARSIPVLQVNTITALESLLAQGVGAAIVAKSAAESIHHAALIKIPLADAEVTRQIYLSWIDAPSNLILAAFINRLREYVAHSPIAIR